MVGKNSISIWFFIGSLLLIYGVIIFIANVYEYINPSFQHAVEMQSLHFGIWWGLLLIVLGVIYFWTFRPWKNKES